MSGTRTSTPRGCVTGPEHQHPPSRNRAHDLDTLFLEPFSYPDHAEDVQRICRNVYNDQDYLPSLLDERYRARTAEEPIADNAHERYFVLCRARSRSVSEEHYRCETRSVAIGGYLLLAPGHYWLQGIRVLEQFRSRGLGFLITRTLLMMLSRLPGAINTPIHVWSCTVTENKPMRRIFHSLGFTESGRYWLWPHDAFMQTLKTIDGRIASAPAFVREAYATMDRAAGLELFQPMFDQGIHSDTKQGRVLAECNDSPWEDVVRLDQVAKELEARRLCVPLYYWCIPPEALRGGAISVDWLWIGRYRGPDDAFGWIFVYREPLIRSSCGTVAGVIASNTRVLFAAIRRLNNAFPRFRVVFDTNMFPSGEARVPPSFRRWMASHWMIHVCRRLEPGSDALAST